MQTRHIDGLTIRLLRNGDTATVSALFERLGPRSREGRKVEVAFAAADDYQGRGLGTILTRELAADARAAGVTELVATVCGDNPRAVSLLARVAQSLQVRWRGGGEQELVARLEGRTG